MKKFFTAVGVLVTILFTFLFIIGSKTNPTNYTEIKR